MLSLLVEQELHQHLEVLPLTHQRKVLDFARTLSSAQPNGISGSALKMPKICGGRLRVNVHRPLDGAFKFARLVLRPSGWSVQCVTDYDGVRLEQNEKAVGLDMGITYLVADSDGGFVKNPKSFRASAKKLSHAQKRLAKCKNGSHRRRKAGKQVARVHERVANQRKDKLHCGYVADRDTNAAQNILLAGTPPSLREREGLANASESPRPLKREAPGL